MRNVIDRIRTAKDIVKIYKTSDIFGQGLLEKMIARSIGSVKTIAIELVNRGYIAPDLSSEDEEIAVDKFISRSLDALTRIILNDYRVVLKGKTEIEKEFQTLELPRRMWAKQQDLVLLYKTDLFRDFDVILDEEDLENLVKKIVLCESVSLFEGSGIDLALPFVSVFDKSNAFELSKILDIGDDSKKNIKIGAGAYAVTGGPSAGKSLFISEVAKILGDECKLIKVLEPGYGGEAEVSLQSIGEILSEALMGEQKVILIDSFRFSSVLLKSIALKNGISAAAFAIATTLTIVAERMNKIVIFVISSETDEKEINNIFFQRLVGACSGVFAPQYGTYAGIASIRDSDRRPFSYSIKGRGGEIQENMVQAFDYVNYSRELFSSIGGVKMSQ